MDGAHAGEPTGGNCPWLVFSMDAGRAYCVPEAGNNYKRQIDAWKFLRIPRQ
jgi:hypothetical protein